MSLKTELEHAAHQAGGSTKTIDTRTQTVRDYARWCQAENIQTRHVADIKAKHLGRYIGSLRERGLSARTCQNRAAHLRVTIQVGGGRRSMPTNQQLGIDGARRKPARTAITATDYHAARAALAGRGHDGARAVLALQRHLGLRAGEAIQSWRSLATWQRQLERGAATIQVLHGTKGGRPRDSHPTDRASALMAIREARTVCMANGNRLLACATLQIARSRYERQCRAVGLSGQNAPHSARYSYARDRLNAYLAQGYDLREARSAVARIWATAAAVPDGSGKCICANRRAMPATSLHPRWRRCAPGCPGVRCSVLPQPRDAGAAVPSLVAEHGHVRASPDEGQ